MRRRCYIKVPKGLFHWRSMDCYLISEVTRGQSRKERCPVCSVLKGRTNHGLEGTYLLNVGETSPHSLI